MNDETEQRIREKAYELWILEGRLDGRELIHWDMARELILQENSSHFTLVPEAGATEEIPQENAPPANLREEPDLSHHGEGQEASDHAADASPAVKVIGGGF